MKNKIEDLRNHLFATLDAELRIVFDAPPSHESGRFVEVENEWGQSVRAGEWRTRPDGLWELVIPRVAKQEGSDGAAPTPADAGALQADRERLYWLLDNGYLPGGGQFWWASNDDYRRKAITVVDTAMRAALSQESQRSTDGGKAEAGDEHATRGLMMPDQPGPPSTPSPSQEQP